MKKEREELHSLIVKGHKGDSYVKTKKKLNEMIKNEYKNRFNKELTDNDTLTTLLQEATYIQQETSDLIVNKDEFKKFSVMYAFDRVFNTNTCMDFLPFDNTILDDDLPF